MAVLITGATGFIGSYVVRRLLDADADFVCVDRSREGCFPAVLGERAAGVEVIDGDVTDFPLLARLVQERGVDRVIHLAAVLGVESKENPGRSISTNITGTHNVLELGRVFELRRVVLASTAAIFGPPELYPDGRVPNDPDVRLFARNVYEGTKVFNETEAQFYATRYGLDVVALRVLAYGYGARRGASKLMLDELLGKPLDGLPGQVEFGDDRMNFIHGEDAAAAFIALANGSGAAFTAYNIRGDYRPVRDAVEIARRLLPGSDIEALPGTHGWAWDADDAPLRRDTGYTPAMTLELGLEDTLDRLRGERARRAS